MNEYPDLRNTKQQLRKDALAVRAQLPIDAISRMVCANLETWPPLREVKQVLFYHPFRNEIDLLPLALKFPEKHWYLPVVSGEKSTTMIFYRYDVEHAMQTGKYGISEPPPHAEPLQALNTQDLILVPGLLFDRNGYRLGYGKGYYDRFLAEREHLKQTCLRVGVTPQALLHQDIPHDSWDRRMDFVVTEAGIETITGA